MLIYSRTIVELKLRNFIISREYISRLTKSVFNLYVYAAFKEKEKQYIYIYTFVLSVAPEAICMSSIKHAEYHHFNGVRKCAT